MLRFLSATWSGLSHVAYNRANYLLIKAPIITKVPGRRKSVKSVFSRIKKVPPIEVFELTVAFLADSDKKKCNLGVGAYRDNDGKPWVFPVVRKTEMQIAAKELHEYLPILGNQKLRKTAPALLLGENSAALCEERAFAVQSLSGTGALRLGADLLARHAGKEVFYYSDPTWDNHKTIFADAGFKKGVKYEYWNPKTLALDFDSLLGTLEDAPKGAVVILHSCAHNPTGVDPTQKQWKQIADLMERKKLFPFFDSAYIGVVSGDPDLDSWSVRYFVERGFELLCAQSFAKNFGLYGERVGALTLVQNDKETSAAVASQLALCIRGNYSNPSAYGSRIVSTILSDEELRAEWKACLCTMATRIKEMRQALYERLTELKTPGSWKHIINQVGMFSYTGLNKKQVEMLIKKHHIYLLSSGRINMCGLNTNNIDYVAKCMDETVKSSKSENK